MVLFHLFPENFRKNWDERYDCVEVFAFLELGLNLFALCRLELDVLHLDRVVVGDQRDDVSCVFQCSILRSQIT